MTRIETDTWPFIPARFYKDIPSSQRRAVNIICIHDMEADEKGSTAEDVANYFRTMPDNRKASAHVCVDNNSIVQSVHDNDVAYAAPPRNNDGIHVELAGYGNQSRGQWQDDYSKAVIENAANVTAQFCLKYEIPAIHLTNQQLSQGERGIVGHVQISTVYQESDHQDPGPNFPWDVFMCAVLKYVELRRSSHGVV